MLILLCLWITRIEINTPCAGGRIRQHLWRRPPVGADRGDPTAAQRNQTPTLSKKPTPTCLRKVQAIPGTNSHRCRSKIGGATPAPARRHRGRSRMRRQRPPPPRENEASHRKSERRPLPKTVLSTSLQNIKSIEPKTAPQNATSDEKASGVKKREPSSPGTRPPPEMRPPRDPPPQARSTTAPPADDLSETRPDQARHTCRRVPCCRDQQLRHMWGTVRATSPTDIKLTSTILMLPASALLLPHLTTERPLPHQSRQLPDFPATAPRQDTSPRRELNTILYAIGLPPSPAGTDL